MKTIGKYIYGIINSNKELSFGPCLPSEALAKEGGTTACREAYPHTKDFGVGVYTISYQDISAVVSDSEILDYTHLLKDTVARYLIRHQQVIEKVMEAFTIIPMRLGTFAYYEGEVRHILAKAYPMVKDIFNKIYDKIEIDVAVTWSDFNSVLKEIAEEEKIKEFKQSLLKKKENVTVDDQMKIGVMVKKALDKKREKYTEEIEKALVTVDQDCKKHELMDDKMVTNSAFLIDKSKHEDFNREVEGLNMKYNEKLNFRCVGPLPPYSFYTLEIKKWQFEEIDWARKKLGLLNEFVTKNEIKEARQTLALSFHPDKNPNTPGIEREFDEVTKAYKVLWEYCQGDSCSFNEEAFNKNAVLVKVRE